MDNAESSEQPPRGVKRDHKKTKEKKKKKRRRQNAEPEGGSIVRPSKEKERRKLNDEESPKNFSADPLAEPTLEGAMVGDTMVLIDRDGGKVYSATERLGNGKLKEVGKISKTGTIEIRKSEKGETKTFRSSGRGKNACIEAGLDVSLSSILGQISC